MIGFVSIMWSSTSCAEVRLTLQVLIWSDAGEDLGHSELHRMWQTAFNGGDGPHSFKLLPIVSYKPNIGLNADRLSELDESDAQRTLPCASQLHISYGASLDPKLMAGDPFYALSEAFALAAASLKQYLNLIEQKLEQVAQDSGEDFNPLPSPRYFKRVLLRLRPQIRVTLNSIQNAQSPEWPSTKSECTERSRSAVERDWKHLERVSHALDNRCQEAITATVTTQDAKKTLARAEWVARLTFLATIFVPLSFVTSFFGMNLKELDDLSIWQWVTISISIMMGTIFIAFINGQDASRLRDSFSFGRKGR